MSPPVALMANLAPAPSTSQSAPASDAGSASSGASANQFHAPLRQAQQQLARQNEPSRPAPAKSPPASTSSSSSSPAHASDKSEHKDDDTAAAAAPGAAAAMLALLGQSVPASAAASQVSAGDGDDGADAVSGAGTSAAGALPATTTLSLLGAIQGAAQGKAGDANDFTKAMDGVQDKSLSMPGLGADDGDAAVGQAAEDSGTAAKGDALANALQALTSSASSSSNQKDASDPLEALKNLAAAGMPTQAQPNVATTPAPHVLTMQSSVGTPAFGQELSQQVTWLGGQDVKEARIRLHPEDLGELDVKVSVKQDHVDVAFIAQHPQAVHAVQQTLTQLDSMLAHHGLSLGQAMVGQGNTGQGSSAQAGGSSGSSAGGEGGLAEGASELASVAAPIVKAVGLVDMFA